MNKYLLTFVLLSGIVSESFAQDNENTYKAFLYDNSVQVELFGHGLFYSVNYEKILFNGNKFKTAGQIGVSYYPPQSGVLTVWVPFLVDEILSFGKYHLEIGGGHVFTLERYPDVVPGIWTYSWTGFFIARAGIRYQKPEGHLIVRLAFTPFFEYVDAFDFHPSGGLSLGYAF